LLISTLLGAVVGSTVSGIISYVLAWQANAAAARLAATERLDRKKAVGLRTILKLKLLADSAYSLNRTIEDGIDKAEAAGVGGPLVFRMPPVAGSSDQHTQFEAEELALLLEAKENDLLNELMLIGQRQQTLEISLRDYAARKLDLYKMLPPPVMEGPVGHHDLTREQRDALTPFVVDIDALAEGIRASSAEQLAKAADAAQRLGPALRKLFNDPAFPTLAVREDIQRPPAAQK
jgi:hypothetical protein